METHEELYELCCKPAQDRIEGKIDKVLEILNGNGKDGLVVKVDRNTSWRKAIAVVMCPVIIAILIMGVKYVLS